jgi:hypothetical protein
MSGVAKALVSLARQQRRSAGMYAAWGRKPDYDAQRCAAEAVKLRQRARKNLAWARQEIDQPWTREHAI